MEKLTHKRENFIKVFNLLQENLQALSSMSREDELYKFVFAGAIQHFELSFETGWKFLQIYLKNKYDLQIDSPKKVFRAFFPLKILDEKVIEELLKISDIRNETAHQYNKENTHEVYMRMSSYCKTLEKIKNIPL